MRVSRRLALVVPLFWGTVGAQESPEPTIQWREKPLDVPVAVSWDLTRSDGGKQGVATHTEHYRETWFVEMRPGLRAFVVSPRARVEVTGVAYQKTEIPRRVVLPEGDLARLLGVPIVPYEEEEDVAPLVALDLFQQNGDGQDYVLPLSEQDYVSVHMNLSL